VRRLRGTPWGAEASAFGARAWARSLAECKATLKSPGIFVTTEFSPSLIFQGQWANMTGDKKCIPLPMKRPTQQDFLDLAKMLESGKLTPVIDRTYPLNEVPEALRYIGKGHAQGKIIIKIGCKQILSELCF